MAEFKEPRVQVVLDGELPFSTALSTAADHPVVGDVLSGIFLKAERDSREGVEAMGLPTLFGNTTTVEAAFAQIATREAEDVGIEFVMEVPSE